MYKRPNVCTFEKKKRKKEADLNQSMSEKQFDSVCTLKKSVKSCTSAVDAKAAVVPCLSLIDTVHWFSTGLV